MRVSKAREERGRTSRSQPSGSAASMKIQQKRAVGPRTRSLSTSVSPLPWPRYSTYMGWAVLDLQWRRHRRRATSTLRLPLCQTKPSRSARSLEPQENVVRNSMPSPEILTRSFSIRPPLGQTKEQIEENHWGIIETFGLVQPAGALCVTLRATRAP